mgnify:CR=1 FL=1
MTATRGGLVSRGFLKSRIVFVVLVLWLVSGVLACNGPEPLRIGAKPFAEQKILANAVDLLLRNRGIDTRPIQICDDTYDCQRRLQSGRIDLMIEYSGTAFRLLGESVPAGRVEAFQKLQKAYEPLGVRWSTRLGFENNYIWMMPEDRAIGREIRSLDDLAGERRAIKVASPPEYVRRSRDGLMATAQRYGIDLSPEPLVVKDTMKRYEAVLDGRADVVVGYSTDGALEAFGMRRLADTLDFFPPYEATIAVREDALKAYPNLERAIDELEGEIDEETMKDLNYAVDVEGRAPTAVARRFLESRGIVDFESKASSTTPTVKIAIDPDGGLDVFESTAVNGVRKVFTDRAVELVPTSTPKESVFRGRTRLAIMGAESFFERAPDGEHMRTRRADALAVLGDRMLHVARQKDAKESSELLPGRVGTTKSRACSDLLQVVGKKATTRGNPERLFAMLRNDQLDTVVVLAESGDAAVADAMATGELELIELGPRDGSKWRFSLPYLRPVRLTADTYPGQTEPVDTMAAQVLLAGPPQHRRTSDDANGPAAGIDTTGHPLSIEDVNALAEAIDIDQAPDPALPSVVNVTRSNGANVNDSWFDGGLLDTILNLGIFIFLGWLGFVVVSNPGTKP